MYLKIIIDLLFLLIFVFFVYKYIEVLIKMKGKIIAPVASEEIIAIRQQTAKPVDFPTYSSQKVGIILYSFLLLFTIVLFLIGVFTEFFSWSFYFLIFLPIANSYNLLNLFAVTDDGVLSGGRFVAWRNIKAFQFVPIDINHKYYGYSKEVNEGYELKIKTRGFPIGCIVTSTEMKERLSNIFMTNRKIIQMEEPKRVYLNR